MTSRWTAWNGDLSDTSHCSTSVLVSEAFFFARHHVAKINLFILRLFFFLRFGEKLEAILGRNVAKGKMLLNALHDNAVKGVILHGETLYMHSGCNGDCNYKCYDDLMILWRIIL